MEFEWDDDKRLINIQKHGYDFRWVNELFENKHIKNPAKTVKGEKRYQATGKAKGKLTTVVYTLRGKKIRIISMRRARHAERSEYQNVHGN